MWCVFQLFSVKGARCVVEGTAWFECWTGDDWTGKTRLMRFYLVMITWLKLQSKHAKEDKSCLQQSGCSTELLRLQLNIFIFTFFAAWCNDNVQQAHTHSHNSLTRGGVVIIFRSALAYQTRAPPHRNRSMKSKGAFTSTYWLHGYNPLWAPCVHESRGQRTERALLTDKPRCHVSSDN